MTGTLPPDEHDSFDLPEVLPLLPIRDLVVFPYMIVPLFVSRDVSIAAIDEALAKDRLVFLAAQRDSALDSPGRDDVHVLDQHDRAPQRVAGSLAAGRAGRRESVP